MKVNPDGTMETEWVTDAFEEITGYTSEEIQRLGGWTKLMHPDDLASGFQMSQIMMDTGERVTFEHRLIHKSGEVRYILAYMQPAMNPFTRKVHHIYGAARDVTREKFAERQVRHNFLTLNEVADVARIGGWEIDLRTSKLKWTRGTYDIHELPYDYQPDVESAIDFYAPSSQPIIMNAVEKLLATGEDYDLELEFITAKGNPLWIRTIGKLEMEDHKAIRVYGIFQDITEKRRIQQTLIDAELEKSRRQILADFLTDISHEFRNPVSTIQTSIYILNRLIDDDDLKKHLSKIDMQTDRINKLLDNMTVMLKLDTQPDYHFRAVNMCTVIEECLQMHHSLFEEKQITFQMHYDQPCEHFVIEGDSGYLRIACSKLIHNAIVYSQPHSAIDLMIEADDTTVQFHLQDQGIGMSAGELSRVFERFYRVDPARHINGIGLGLSISKTIIEDHKGTVILESEPQNGTIVHVRLPRLHP